ncbi:hypothetical protein OROMI_019833 [Orobanche minor]
MLEIYWNAHQLEFNKINMDTILKKIMLEFPQDTDITYPLMMEVISAGVGRLGKHSWVVSCGWLDDELFHPLGKWWWSHSS